MGFDTGLPGDTVEIRLAILLGSLQAQRIGALHVGRLLAALGDPDNDTRQVREDLKRVCEALADNPAPQQEARALLRYFDEDQLARLLLVSRSSIQRYASGERTAKGPVIDRLHWLALVVGLLTGTYNEYGVRRWFERPRKALGGPSPQEVLLVAGDWTPDDLGARRVEELAKATIGMVAS
ncbi:MAG: hypothetical protein KF813_03080 [Trueperaceae bacterium]|nr:hypothetical protein [Trueperaceae bacterium]